MAKSKRPGPGWLLDAEELGFSADFRALVFLFSPFLGRLGLKGLRSNKV